MANPLQYSCLENPMDRGAWRAAVHGVAKSQTLLKLTPICVYIWAHLWAAAPYPPRPVSVGKHVTWTFTRGTLHPECLSTRWSPPRSSGSLAPRQGLWWQLTLGEEHSCSGGPRGRLVGPSV